MAYRRYQPRSSEQWRDLITQQAASGQNQIAFCAAHGVSKTTFQHWKRRLGLTRGAASAGAGAPTRLFAPLAAPPDTASPEVGERSAQWTIELDLGAGVCLRLRRSEP